jgi:hypothetical protein
MAGMEGSLSKLLFNSSYPIYCKSRGIAAKAFFVRAFRKIAVAAFLHFAHFTEPLDVLLCKTGASNHLTSNYEKRQTKKV